MAHIGIDFGTTYSCIAYYNDGNIEIIPDEFGKNLIPTCVHINEYNNIFIGNLAIDELKHKPSNTITNIKKLLIKNSVNHDLNYVTKLDKNNKVYVEIPVHRIITIKEYNKDIDKEVQTDKDIIVNIEYYPEDIISYIFEYLKKTAEIYLNKVVIGAVITAPAYFNDNQKKVLYDAASRIGLNIKQIISEPTAAALCYISDDGIKYIIVYDIGGGTLDISVVEVNNKKYTVLLKVGDSELGGTNFDLVLEKYLIGEFIKQNPGELGIYDDIKATTKLRYNAENIKKKLSVLDSVTMEISNVYKGKNVKVNITVQQFISLSANLLNRCNACLASLLKQFGKNTVIDDLIFIGGTSRIPIIRENAINMIQARQSKEINIHTKINPDEAVARGAAIQSNSIEQTTINSCQLIEIVPQNIGIQVASDTMSILIEKNTKIPCSKKSVVETYFNNQTRVVIKIYQGDNPSIKYNTLIGKFDIDNLPPKPKGEIKISLELVINKNNLLVVKIYEPNTNTNKTYNIADFTKIQAKEEILYNNRMLYKEIIRLNYRLKDAETDTFIKSKLGKNIDFEDSKEYLDILEKLKSL